MMSKKILVAVTGSTPQILTETIYALYKEKNWVPDEVHVLTTTHGKDGIEKYLLGNGQFQALCNEYDLSEINFTLDSVHVICDEDNNKLEDIKTVQDNDHAANHIVKFIHDLCQNPNNELHVSLAGGRKSMGFYIGYALSLFGRAQDSMSHVLVSDPYDTPGDFYFPTKESKLVNIYPKGRQNAPVEVDAKDAKIWLADIPFVRMGVGYVPVDLSEENGYRQAVELTQTKVSDYSIVVNLKEKSIVCNQKLIVKLSPQQIVFYSNIAKATKEDKYVTAYESKVNKAYPITQLIKDYLKFYSQVGKHTDDTEESLIKLVGDIPDILYKFAPASANIDKKLQSTLGEIASHFAIKSAGDNYGKYYFLAIKPENITIIE